MRALRGPMWFLLKGRGARAGREGQGAALFRPGSGATPSTASCTMQVSGCARLPAPMRAQRSPWPLQQCRHCGAHHRCRLPLPTCACVLVRAVWPHSVAQAAHGMHNGHSTIGHGIQLVEAAGLEAGGHEQHVGACSMGAAGAAPEARMRSRGVWVCPARRTEREKACAGIGC